jgi:hypothetical protein
MIKFTETNNEIIEKSLLHLKFHKKEKMYYWIKNINENNFVLINVFNSTDIMLLQNYYK